MSQVPEEALRTHAGGRTYRTRSRSPVLSLHLRSVTASALAPDFKALWLLLSLLFPAFLLQVGDIAAPTPPWGAEASVGLGPSVSDLLLFGAEGCLYWCRAIWGLADLGE